MRDWRIRAIGPRIVGHSLIVGMIWRRSTLRLRCGKAVTVEQRLYHKFKLKIRILQRSAYLSLLSLACRLHTVSTLDNVRFEGDRPRCAVKLEEEATCVA